MKPLANIHAPRFDCKSNDYIWNEQESLQKIVRLLDFFCIFVAVYIQKT